MDHWDLKMFPWDERTPRFYPPGQHPATFRWQAHLANALELQARGARGGEEVIAYLQDKIAEFEQVESELKAEYALRQL